MDRHGRAGTLGEPEFRESADTTSVFLDRPVQRDNLDSGVIISTEADLEDNTDADTSGAR